MITTLSLISLVLLLSTLISVALLLKQSQENKSLQELSQVELKERLDKLSSVTEKLSCVEKQITDFEKTQEAHMASLKTKQDSLIDAQDKTSRSLKEEINTSRQAQTENANAFREQTLAQLKDTTDTLATQSKNTTEALTTNIKDISSLQQEQLSHFAKQLNSFAEQLSKRMQELGQISKEDMAKMREIIEKSIKELQADNATKLEQMRVTVDEKLQSTLEKRLNDSFKQVSERLEQVHKGLGEMQNLATGVGDLKRVLTNVKTRGTWGEVQLGTLLEDILSPEQFSDNVGIKRGSQERVDFAVRFPGNTEEGDEVLLPIDSKFPIEDYQLLVEAQDRGDLAAIEEAVKKVKLRVEGEARSIRDKYISPPKTTNFAILFLPTEGLYAEVLRIPGLASKLQNEHRVIISGPTTMAALLNSLQVGFTTLKIQKNSELIAKTLRDVSKEFGNFGNLLEKTKQRLAQATDEIDKASIKSRKIESKLSKVQELPNSKQVTLRPSLETASLS